jgi:hypothetical protein
MGVGEPGRRRFWTTAGGQMIAQERGNGYPGEIVDGQVLGRDPAAEVLNGSNIFLDKMWGMPSRDEISDDCFGVRTDASYLLCVDLEE